MTVLALAVLLHLLFRRRKNGKVSPVQNSTHEENDEASSALGTEAPLEKDGQVISNEIGGEGLSHEIGAGRQLLEMDAY